MRKSTRLLTIGLAFVMLFAMLAFSVSAAETKFTDVSAKDETLTKAVALLEGYVRHHLRYQRSCYQTADGCLYLPLDEPRQEP